MTELIEMEPYLLQFLVDPTDDLGIDSQVMRQPIGQNLLIEPQQDRDLAPKFREALLPVTGAVCDIAGSRPIDHKRPAEQTLAATQKVGCTSENPMPPRNHAASSLPNGYETP